MILKNKIQTHVKRIIPIHMLKDIKEKYNTRTLPRIQATLVTKGATNKNFYHEKKNFFYATMEMKSFTPHCIHCKP
jgi:hypothetical protein